MSSLDPANPQAFGQDIISAVANQLAAELANSPVDSRAIARGAVKMLSRLVPGTWVAVIMNDDPTTSHVVAADERAPAMAAYMDRYVADLYAAGQATTTGLSQHVIDSGEHVLMPTLPLADFILLATPAGQEYLARHPYPVPIESVGLLIAPMRSLGATIGTLGVFQYNTATALSETDVGWLQKVADRVGIAIDHAQLRAPAIERQERLAAITNIALTISSTQGLRLTLDSIVKQAAMRLKVDAADVLVVEESTNDLQVAVSTGFRSPTIPNYRFPVPPEISATYPGGARFEVPAEMDWIGQYRRRSLFAREGFQAYRLAPLVMQNRFVGAMEVFHRSPLVPDREWIGFFEALASHAAIAVDNATDRARLQAGARETAIKSTAPVPELTLKDRQILGLIIDGATNQEIADRLHISHNTVKFHVRRLLGKAGAANRTDLAARVTRLGWLAPGLT